MKQHFVPAFQGLNTDIAARRLPEHRCSAADNVMFKDGLVYKRWGTYQYAGVDLDDPIMTQYLFETAISGIKQLIVFTTKNVYILNENTGAMEYKNPTYIKGTVTVSGTGVEGTGTFWKASWLTDFPNIRIGFGTTDQNAVSTWYTVQSITDNDTLTLSATAGAITGTTYVIQFQFSGDADNPFSVASPYHGKPDDKIVVACNGVNPIIWYFGSGNFSIFGEYLADYAEATNRLTLVGWTTDGLFAGMPVYGVGDSIAANVVILSVDSSTQVTITADGTTAGGMTLPGTAGTLDDYPVWFGYRRPAKFLGYFGSVGFEHFVTAWIKGASTNEPQRIEVGAAGNYPESYLNDVTGDYGTYYLLLDTNEEINAMEMLQNRVIVYKENSITEMWAVPGGNNSDPYNFYQDKIRDIAPISAGVIVNYGRFHIFMGWDNFYLFDGINAQPIGDEVIDTIRDELNETYAHRAFAFAIREENLYVIMYPHGSNELPSRCYAYNYMEKHWTKWTFTDGAGAAVYYMSAGRFRVTQSDSYATIDNTGTLYSGISLRWEDMILYENFDRYLLGDSTGILYKFQPEYADDNGYGFESTFTTKDFAMENPKYTKKVLEVIVGMTAQSSGSIYIRASADFGNTWTEWRTLAMSGVNEYIESIGNVYVRGKQMRFQISNYNGVTTDRDYFEVENMNIGYNESGLAR